jgi:light-regulated signal transduction histidine kinase (bacteriophytochrome)
MKPDEAGVLQPRNSFSVWIEDVREKCNEWTAFEKTALCEISNVCTSIAAVLTARQLATQLDESKRQNVKLVEEKVRKSSIHT